MRVIIVGAGEVGTHLAKLLSREKMDISLMDERADRIEGLDADYDMLTKVGVPTSIRDLQDIGVRDVDLFVAVTPSETENMTACLIANQLGAKKTLARIDNYEYLLPENKRFRADGSQPPHLSRGAGSSGDLRIIEEELDALPPDPL